jgi:hypothetical protein
MKSFRFVLISLSVIFFLGCAGSSKKMNKLKIGMTKQEVIEAIGQPNSSSAIRNVESLRYRLNPGGFSPNEYYVKLLDGKVVTYGKRGDYNLPN